MNAQTVPFTDHGTTQQSANDDGPRIAVAADPDGTGLAQLAAGRLGEAGRLYVGVFAGTQRTGGYAVRATFSAPATGALTIQVITSPAQLVSIPARAASGAREAVLVDQSGSERARTTVPQSQP